MGGGVPFAPKHTPYRASYGGSHLGKRPAESSQGLISFQPIMFKHTRQYLIPIPRDVSRGPFS